MRRKVVRNVLVLVSLGLAVHLVLPQIPGLEKSLGLLVNTSHVLVLTALAAEIASQSCYAALLGRAVRLTSGPPGARRETGIWFMLRLTVCNYGASHVLPGGGAAGAAVVYGALRNRGFDSGRVGLALAVVTAFVYAALGVIFAGSLAYLYANRDLGAAASIAVLAALLLTILALAAGYAAYRNPSLARRLPAWVRRSSERLGSRLREQSREARRRLAGRPVESVKLAALAFGYWGFDALCLVLMFRAFGVPAGPVELLVAYGIATAAGSLPLTPGGIGVFETSMVATLALLGVGSGAVIPVLGYRLFSFWLPIPLAAIFYPTLHRRARTIRPS